MSRGRASTPSATVDIQALAAWMDRDVEWLRHVLEYHFGCGCDFDYEDIKACSIWTALQEVRVAESRLLEAQQRHENEMRAGAAMEVGK